MCGMCGIRLKINPAITSTIGYGVLKRLASTDSATTHTSSSKIMGSARWMFCPYMNDSSLTISQMCAVGTHFRPSTAPRPLRPGKESALEQHDKGAAQPANARFGPFCGVEPLNEMTTVAGREFF